MQDKIDYLALERQEHKVGSYNGNLKDLIISVRYVREKVPANELQQHLPSLRAKERKLQELDEQIGEPRRNYIEEIFEELNNEPEDDDSNTFAVYEIRTKDNKEIALVDTGLFFYQKVLAEEWVRDSGVYGVKYTVLNVLENKF